MNLKFFGKPFPRLAVVVFSLTLSACASSYEVVSPSQLAEKPPAYNLGPGDKVKVTVFGEQSVNGEYLVGTDGTIALPLIGNVVAGGQTVASLQGKIVDRLHGDYLLDPRVSVEVLNYRPFFILGEIQKAGSYPYVDSLTVSQAVASAGGYTYRANSSVAFIRRNGEGDEKAYRLGDKPIWVLPGDTIRIGERYF